MSALARYDEMCRAIEACHAMDEVKDIRDRAMAFQHYAQQAQDLESERKCIAIRLRAERRAGQLLKEMEKASAGRPPKNRSSGTTDLEVGSPDTTPPPRTLKDMGISKDQSSKWQKLADVPEEKFEEALADTSAPPSTANIIRQHEKASGGPEPPPAPPGFVKATEAIGTFNRLAEFCRENEPGFVAGGVLDYEIAELKTDIAAVADWLDRFAHSFKETA